MRRKILIILGIIIILLISFRIALPYTMVWYVNRSIQDLPDYQGRVNNVDLQLLRGMLPSMTSSWSNAAPG
jgi:hypothetical protein